MRKPKWMRLGTVLLVVSFVFIGCSNKGGEQKKISIQDETPLYTIFWVAQGFNDSIITASYSPDGKLIASGADASDEYLHISDASTGKLIKTIKTPHTWEVAFSPDGKTLAGGSHGTVKIWETSTWTEVLIIPYVSTSLRSMTYSPDGKIIATSGLDSSVSLWDPVSGKKIKKINIDGFGWFVEFSPDGKYLATGGNPDVKVIEMSSGKVILTLKGYIYDPMNTANNDTFTAVFSPNGLNLITGGADRTIRIWEIPSGKMINKFEKHQSAIKKLAITPDGKILVSANWIDLNIYDLTLGKIIRVIPEIQKTVGMDISPDGKSIVTGGEDRILRVWKLAN